MNDDKDRAWKPGAPNGQPGYRPPLTLTDFLLYVRSNDDLPKQLRDDIQQTAAIFREKYGQSSKGYQR